MHAEESNFETTDTEDFKHFNFFIFTYNNFKLKNSFFSSSPMYEKKSLTWNYLLRAEKKQWK
jgi:hypothetical protein